MVGFQTKRILIIKNDPHVKKRRNKRKKRGNIVSGSVYTYGYDVYKETFQERMERAKGEEYDDEGYIIEKNPPVSDVNENHSHSA